MPGNSRGPQGARRRQVRRILRDYAFILPQLTLYVAFTIVPFFVGLPMAFTDMESFTDTEVAMVGASNFVEIARDPILKAELGGALVRTLRFTGLNYLMVYLFGMVLALLMYEIGFRGGFFTIIYLPMMVSGLAIGFMATMLFAQSSGTMNLLLLQLGWIKAPIDIKQASGVTLFLPLLMGWRSAGFNMALFLAGLLAIPKETIEAATIDGASYLQRLLRVYFPQMMPSFIIATIFCLINSFNIFETLIALGAMTGNQEARFLSVLFFEYGFNRGRLALGLELGIPLFIVGLLLQRLQRHLQYQV